MAFGTNMNAWPYACSRHGNKTLEFYICVLFSLTSIVFAQSLLSSKPGTSFICVVVSQGILNRIPISSCSCQASAAPRPWMDTAGIFHRDGADVCTYIAKRLERIIWLVSASRVASKTCKPIHLLSLCDFANAHGRRHGVPTDIHGSTHACQRLLGWSLSRYTLSRPAIYYDTLHGARRLCRNLSPFQDYPNDPKEGFCQKSYFHFTVWFFAWSFRSVSSLVSFAFIVEIDLSVIPRFSRIRLTCSHTRSVIFETVVPVSVSCNDHLPVSTVKRSCGFCT